MYFLALSQAPPPEVIEIATNSPVTITPSSMRAERGRSRRLPACPARDRVITKYTTIGDSTGSSDGMIISLIAALVSEIDGAAVIRLVGALHDAGLLAELAADVLDDRAGRAADRGHAHRAEQIGQQAAEQQADDDVGIVQREVRDRRP